MPKSIDVARFLLCLDADKSVFAKHGNVKLDKFLYLAQKIYIAKTGERLITDDNSALTDEQNKFLKKFFKAFKSAELDELIALSHDKLNDDIIKVLDRI